MPQAMHSLFGTIPESSAIIHNSAERFANFSSNADIIRQDLRNMADVPEPLTGVATEENSIPPKARHSTARQLE